MAALGYWVLVEVSWKLASQASCREFESRRPLQLVTNKRTPVSDLATP